MYFWVLTIIQEGNRNNRRESLATLKQSYDFMTVIIALVYIGSGNTSTQQDIDYSLFVIYS